MRRSFSADWTLRRGGVQGGGCGGTPSASPEQKGLWVQAVVRDGERRRRLFYRDARGGVAMEQGGSRRLGPAEEEAFSVTPYRGTRWPGLARTPKQQRYRIVP